MGKSGGRMWPVVVITLLLAKASAAGAQSAGDSPPAVHARCRDPHSFPTCGSYFLFEFSGAGRVIGSTTERSCPFPSPDCTRPALPSWFGWDVGLMKNRGATRSLGASLQIGGSEEGTRIALRARHRSWLANDMVVDAAAGPLMTQLIGRNQEGTSQTWGATGDVGVGRARLGMVTVGADVARQLGRTEFAVHAGGRVESAGVAIVSALAAIGGLVVVAALSDGGLFSGTKF